MTEGYKDRVIASGSAREKGQSSVNPKEVYEEQLLVTLPYQAVTRETEVESGWA